MVEIAPAYGHEMSRSQRRLLLLSQREQLLRKANFVSYSYEVMELSFNRLTDQRGTGEGNLEDHGELGVRLYGNPRQRKAECHVHPGRAKISRDEHLVFGHPETGEPLAWTPSPR